MIPDEIMQELMGFCDANALGLARVLDKETGIMVLLVAPNHMSPNDVGIVAANMLLTGVVTGIFTGDNNNLVDKDELTN